MVGRFPADARCLRSSAGASVDPPAEAVGWSASAYLSAQCETPDRAARDDDVVDIQIEILSGLPGPEVIDGHPNFFNPDLRRIAQIDIPLVEGGHSVDPCLKDSMVRTRRIHSEMLLDAIPPIA